MKLYPSFPRIISVNFSTWIAEEKREMTSSEIESRLAELLWEHTDNCGRKILPELGKHNGFIVRPLYECTPNKECRQGEFFLSKLDGRVILSQDMIYFNEFGNAEHYGRKRALPVEKFDEFMQKPFTIRGWDIRYAHKYIYDQILGLFEVIS